MDKLILIIILIGVIIIGFIMKMIEIKDIYKRHEFTYNYRNKFIELANTIFSKKLFDQNLYYELTTDVNAMQYELGADGIMPYVKDEIKGYAINNYQMLVNFLPELKNAINEMDNPIMSRRFLQGANECDDMFIRHIGTLKEYEKNAKKNLFNPFYCFSEGVKNILSIPFLLLKWFGFISSERTIKIKNSWIIGVLNFLGVILGALSSIVYLVLEKEKFLQIVNNFIFDL